VADAEPTLTRAANPRLRWLKSLSGTRERRREGVAVAEGLKVLRELVPLADRVVRLFWSEACARHPDGMALVAAFRERGVPTNRVAPALLERLADTRQPQGAIAVVRSAPVSLDAVLGGTRDLLVLEGVQDPGNVGTLVRTAEAAGAAGVVLAGACADPTGPKCVRAAAGSLFRVPYVVWPEAPEGLAERIRSAGHARGRSAARRAGGLGAGGGGDRRIGGLPAAGLVPGRPPHGPGSGLPQRGRGRVGAALRPPAAGLGAPGAQQASMQRNTDSSRPRPQ